jgi:hypothetical protein
MKGRSSSVKRRGDNIVLAKDEVEETNRDEPMMISEIKANEERLTQPKEDEDRFLKELELENRLLE